MVTVYFNRQWQIPSFLSNQIVAMTTNRLEAFSDGVMAIIITIMVLGLSVPVGSNIEALKPMVPRLISYVLSFLYVGIYWNNHHHLFQAIEKVNGKILWFNLILLFTLTLVPLSTAWMGENHFAKIPVAIYGINLLCCATAYAIVVKAAISFEGQESKIAKAIKKPIKEYLSIAAYLIGIIGACYVPKISVVIYFLVGLMWVIPDRRIESKI